MPIQKITSGVIESSQTLTTPTISGNLSLDSTGTTGVRVPSANTMAFHTAGTEDMRIDSSGNVGIGTTSPDYNLQVEGSGDRAIAITSTTSADCRLWLGDTAAPFNGAVIYRNDSDSLAFNTAATEHMRITSAGDLRFNSGYGSVAAAYGCRAWVNFNGTGTVAIRASGNVSSITDNGTGLYTANFTNAMPDANYAAMIGANINNSNTDMRRDSRVVTWSTSNVFVVTGDSSGNSDTKEDYEFVTIAVFR